MPKTDKSPFTIKKENRIVEIKKKDSFSVAVSCVVTRYADKSARGLIHRLHDPEEHSPIAINVWWSDGSTGHYSFEAFRKECFVVSAI